LVAVDDELRARGRHVVVLAAHEDGLLGAGIDAEAAIDTAEEVDLETRGYFSMSFSGRCPASM
jgi:hypothetical protein